MLYDELMDECMNLRVVWLVRVDRGKDECMNLRMDWVDWL